MTQQFIYVTAGSEDEAARLGRSLVEARLAACANVLGPVRSFYWWEGSVQESAEAVLILKTRQDLVDALIAKVRAEHSYDCPCVVALPIEAGNPEFLAWIDAETQDL
jgi:periplasmic divalent cation tolerance protein